MLGHNTTKKADTQRTMKNETVEPRTQRNLIGAIRSGGGVGGGVYPVDVWEKGLARSRYTKSSKSCVVVVGHFAGN